MPEYPTLIDHLMSHAHLPDVLAVEPLTGRGFDVAVYKIMTDSGSTFIARLWSPGRQPETKRFRLLEQWGVKTPGLLAAHRHGSLYEYIEGQLLGDLMDQNADTDAQWIALGKAYAVVHKQRFPPLIAGQLRPSSLIASPHDPVQELISLICASESQLRRILPRPDVVIDKAYVAIRDAEDSLRSASTALCHGDVNMWNIILRSNNVTLIDWDYPRIADPARELALLDKHASLFSGEGLPVTFFAQYDAPYMPRNYLAHRLVQTLFWLASDDWVDFANEPLLADRAAGWFERLRDYVSNL